MKDRNSGMTLKTLLSQSTEKFGGSDAFLLKDEDGYIFGVTYERFSDDCEAFGTALLKQFGSKKKNVAIYLGNCYEWCVAFMAVCGSALTVMPLDRQLPGEELMNIMGFAEIDTVVTDSRGESLMAGYAAAEKIQVINVDGGGKDFAFADVIKKGRELLREGDQSYREAKIEPNDTAAVLFTSGTTGMTKGVMLSHGNICSDLLAVSQLVRIEREDVTMSVLPLHHAYELIAFLMVIYRGASVSFGEGIRHLQEDFAAYRPTVFVTVPLLLEKMHDRIIRKMEEEGKVNRARLISKMSTVIPEDSRKKIFAQIHEFFGGRLKKIVVGAASVQKQTVRDFASYGIPVIIGYGLTECSPIAICNSDSEPMPDGIGKPLPGAEAKIADPDENGVGEILIKGPMVMKGYYKNPTQTAAVIMDGWLHTGDIGYIDKRGYYHISGRIKNVIVTRNGKNVYPEELEYYLEREGAVAECLVSLMGGDIIGAEILPDSAYIGRKLKLQGEPSSDELHRAVKEAVRAVNRKLPSYKRIKKVVIRKEEFEKTTTRKIKR
ncbi:MAG: AMP-binding protein [Oscillospiraceae bacterium]|nr:AMP-binding protein [Oscillospiraceae bacterium]